MTECATSSLCFILFGILHTHTKDKEWKEVIYIHNEKKLEGKVCGATGSKWSYGPIQATHCAIQIGYGNGLDNFVGDIDDDTEWKEVIYIHNEKKLEGKVCGATGSKWSYGPIQATYCAIQIGYGNGLDNFVGDMDDLYIYQCRPRASVLNLEY